jgi:hypothetical protein
MSATMTRRSHQEEFDLDFDAELPPKMEFFPVWFLGKLWHCSAQHVINLVDSGELKVPVDLKGKAASKTMIRVPRASVVEFLNRRKVRP